MIVCMCLSITDRQIRKAVREGTLGEILNIPKMGIGCGICVSEIQSFLIELQSCKQDQEAKGLD